jgi:hypothetical protein
MQRLNENEKVWKNQKSQFSKQDLFKTDMNAYYGGRREIN